MEYETCYFLYINLLSGELLWCRLAWKMLTSHKDANWSLSKHSYYW